MKTQTPNFNWLEDLLGEITPEEQMESDVATLLSHRDIPKAHWEIKGAYLETLCIGIVPILYMDDVKQRDGYDVWQLTTFDGDILLTSGKEACKKKAEELLNNRYSTLVQMDTYTIGKAYHWTESDEIEISSPNLLYSELETELSGCQCINMDNQPLIHEKCRQVAKLIREIGKLNKPK